jgi:catecholate siderophore receptor
MVALSSIGLSQTATPSTATESTTTTTSTTTAAAPPASATPTTAQTQAAAGEPVKMATYQVNDVPIEDVILPNARPLTSVFGTEDNIIDIPRDVTIISREQMDTIGIQDVTDFSKLTAASYTDSNFGAPGNPSIRGQSADVFVNGMRQRVTSNGNGAPLDFNSVESVNIVKGPATAVQGASGYVGGFADMITKQPYFDGFQGSVSYTAGSYDTNRWNVDVGGPISPTLAYRLSYSGEWSNEYWDGAFKHLEAIYGAITWRPTSSYSLFLNGKVFVGKYSENFGIDRPTQLLIDDGLYQSGININNGAGVAPSDSQNSKYVVGGFGSNTIAFGPLVPVDYHWRLQGPGSQSHAHEYNAQAVQTLLLGPDSKIVNNSFFSLTQRDTFGTHYYSEIIAPTWFIENRTEFIDTLKGLNNSVINFGLAERYQHTKAYDDFYFEPANVWDLSASRSGMILDSVNFPLTVNSAQNFPGGPIDVPVPGWPGRYATPQTNAGNDDTNDSQDTSVSPFIQATWKLTPVLSLITGARDDAMHVVVKDPLAVAGGIFPTEPSASINVNDPNFNASLVYKITPKLSAYGTYNFSENYTGALANGGGFSGLTMDAAGNWFLPKDNFDQQSVLYEAGLKTSADDDKLYSSVAVFQQSRQQKAQGQPAVEELFHGLEFETNFQPDKHFYATLGYSLLIGSLDAPVPFQGYSTNQVPNGPPSPFGPGYQTTGKLRVPGYPEHTINLLTTYQWDNGFGVSVDGVITSTINNDYQGYLVIPWQETFDASAFWKSKKYEFRLSATNVLNAHNWTPAYPTYGLEAIVPDAGFEIFGTVKYRF